MIKVVKPGFFTSIQDRGRFGFRHFGVPVSGVMDQNAAEIANELLENEPEAALLEITMTGPVLEFSVPTFIAVTGAPMDIYINDEEKERNTVLEIAVGDRLHFGKLEDGFRAYLAVKGGIQTETVLNSRSQYMPLTPTNHLQKGEELPIEAITGFEPKITALKRHRTEDPDLEVTPGPEWDMLSPEMQQGVLQQTFTVAKENNRMAYQLVEPIEPHTHSMLTSATLPGTVQYTPSGKLLILMRDAQTTGGYPRILQLTEEAVARLAQKKTGDDFRFRLSEDQMRL